MSETTLDKIKYAYWKVVPYHLRPGQLWYQFKCWVWHRYSTVKPRHLGHTWVDRSELMPHTIFEILSDFIEKECGDDCHVQWYADESDTETGWTPHTVEVAGEQVNVRDEMQDLYDWWHKDYLINIEHIHDEWHKHREKHVKDVFVPVVDDETIELTDDDESLVEWTHEYSSPEAEVENERLFKEAAEREEHYRKELNSRLHRVINIIPYMWT